MRRIGLTGATGFLGGRVRQTLEGRDDVEVTEIGRRPSGPDAEFVEFDLRSADPDRLSDLTADAILHLAALIPDDQSSGGMRRAERVNGGGTIRLVEACRRAGIERVVLASSCHLRDPRRPELVRNLYEGSKQSAERYAGILSGHYHISRLVLRFPYLYGAEMRHGDLFPSLLRRAESGERIEIHHGGLAQVRLLHVDDAARAVVRGIGSALGVEGTYNVAPARPTDVADIARAIVDATDSDSETVPVGDAADAPPVSLLDPPAGETRTDLGWEPRVSLRRGVAELLESSRIGRTGERR